jgi:hypothetical protein
VRDRLPHRDEEREHEQLRQPVRRARTERGHQHLAVRDRDDPGQDPVDEHGDIHTAESVERVENALHLDPVRPRYRDPIPAHDRC